ncbi:MAG: hypothetical protein K8J08_08030 [Thermoanaerobaculia bacterium]|nr:hypothetical protein [Thermoanaerobaculia bacterium]
MHQGQSETRVERAVFWGLLSLYGAQIWSLPFVPTQDGPAHLATAEALRFIGDSSHPWLADVLEVSSLPTPMWGMSLVLSGLVHVLSAALTEKILVTGYLLTFGLAIRYALGVVSPKARFLSVLALPFAPNYLFHMGFYSYCFSVVLLLAMLGWWHRRRGEGVSLGRLAGWGVLLWIAHPVTAVAGGMSLGLMALWNGWASSLERGLPALRAGVRNASWVALAFSPAALLVLWIRSLQGGATLHWFPMSVRWRVLAFSDVVGSFRPEELWVGFGITALPLFLTAFTLRRRWVEGLNPRGDDAFLMASLFCGALFFVAPNSATTPEGWTAGGFVSHRLSLLVPLLLLLWLGGQVWGRWIRATVVVAGAVFALMLMALHQPTYRRASTGFVDIAGASSALPPGSTFLWVDLAPYGPPGERISGKVRLFEHAGDRLSWTAEAVNLEANQYRSGWQFPLVFRPEVLAVPLPSISRGGVSGFETVAEELIDHLVVWGLSSERGTATVPWLGSLESEWHRTWISPRGWTQVYSRRGTPPP